MNVPILSPSRLIEPADGAATPSTASAVSPDERKALSGIQDGGEAVAPPARVVCAWCDAVMQEGAEPTSHGMCPTCSTKARAELLDSIKVYAPLHVLPAQDRIGGYVIRDDRDRLLVDFLVGVNAAAALAHSLNRAIHGYGLCLLHLNERRQDGSCFPCSLGAARHPYAAVGR